MARPLRIEFPGAVYHVTSRGNAQAAIFVDGVDRNTFLAVLRQTLRRFNVLCHAYCLMTNHFHLLLETPDANLSKAMRQLNSVYTQAFNRRHGRVGHVLQGRFKAIVVDREAYLLELCRYVVLNPVRAGMVKDVGKYPWSSYRATAGLDKVPEFLSVDWILEQFGLDRKSARTEYRRFIEAGMNAEESPWDDLKGQCFLGDDAFLEKLFPLLKEKSALKEVPRAQRFVDRPSLESILANTANREERDSAIGKACLEFGYSQAQVAAAAGLHYSTVSRIIRSKESRFKI
ncbi:MAG: transposase [Desulfomicrobium sp.]|nr:transposase [Pseudomonadota bacterium]MBU4569799.1 transposase [Pseudomonadota bacterium]MBV1711128.1 transposase [Desulfomicrobium sp.]